VNAALTGHLLISTLHTNDSATTFPRLVDMGVPAFLVASTVNVAMGQRLIRTICNACKEEVRLTDQEMESLKEINSEADITDKYYKGKGCNVCSQSGYQGRVGIREVLEVNEEIRHLIMEKGSAQQIKEAAVRNGMTTMIRDGFLKAAKGITTVEEVLRIINE
jgi:type II secretory ATPase GspE/PulE/Tfp pilus assembly ATPase PilB-like protein